MSKHQRGNVRADANCTAAKRGGRSKERLMLLTQPELPSKCHGCRSKDTNRMCFDFEKTGQCRFGDQCKYSHGEQVHIGHMAAAFEERAKQIRDCDTIEEGEIYY